MPNNGPRIIMGYQHFVGLGQGSGEKLGDLGFVVIPFPQEIAKA